MTYDSEKHVPFLLVDCPVDKVDVEMQGSFLNYNKKGKKSQCFCYILKYIINVICMQLKLLTILNLGWLGLEGNLK